MTSTAPRPPAGRYGPERTWSPRRTKVALWTLGVLGLLGALWLGVGAARTPVTWDDVGFSLATPGEVTVTYDVHRIDPSVAVRCTIEALDQRYVQVGVVDVDVPPGTELTERLTTTVRTTAPAVTGVVKHCQVP